MLKLMRALSLLLLLTSLITAQNPGAEKLFNDAMAAQQRGDLGAAVTGYEQVLKLKPNLVPARANLAAALMQLNRLDDAAANYRAALAQAPGNLQLSMLLGNCLILARKYAEAMNVLGPLEKAHPDNLDVAFLAGEGLIGINQQAEGLKRVERVAGARNSADAWMLAGLTQLKLSEYAKARDSLDAALRANPALPGAYTLSGIAKTMLGDRVGAKAAFQKALDMDPNDFDANLRFGFALYKERDLEDARKYLALALQINPTSVSARYEMAQLEVAEGRDTEAAAALEAIVHDYPTLLKPHVQLAALYYRLHRQDDGKRERQIVDDLLAHPEKQAADPSADVEGGSAQPNGLAPSL